MGLAETAGAGEPNFPRKVLSLSPTFLSLSLCVRVLFSSCARATEEPIIHISRRFVFQRAAMHLVAKNSAARAAKKSCSNCNGAVT